MTLARRRKSLGSIQPGMKTPTLPLSDIIALTSQPTRTNQRTRTCITVNPPRPIHCPQGTPLLSHLAILHVYNLVLFLSLLSSFFDYRVGLCHGLLTSDYISTPIMDSSWYPRLMLIV